MPTVRGAVAVVTRDNYVTWEMKALYRAARRLSVPLVRIDPMRWAFEISSATFKSLSRGFCRQDPTVSAALGRIDQDALLQGARILEMLDRSGVPTMNGAASVRIGRDKALTALALAQCAVPQPECTILSALPVDRLRDLAYPVVVKPLIGSKGGGVSRANGPKELALLLKACGSPRLVQRFVTGVERELRLVILDGAVLASVKKVAAAGEWRANLSLGGSAVPAQGAKESVDAALRAAQAVHADFAAVDLLETDRGPFVIDVNVCPGFQHVEAATAADIAGRLITSLCGRAAR